MTDKFDRAKKAAQILRDLDLTILTDIKDESFAPCYYVGWPQELAAGIRGGCCSPYFDTEQEAIDWVIANEDKLNKEYGED